MSYIEKLKDPRWQKKRLKVMDYAEWRCQLCGNGEETLHVHHSYYERRKLPWEYPDGSLIALCATCHGKQHPEKQSKEVLPTQENPPEDERETTKEEIAAQFAELRRMLAGK